MAKNKITNGLKDDRLIMVLLGFILAFMWINNPLSRDVVIPNLIFLGLAYLISLSNDYKKYLIGIESKNIFKAVLYGGFAIIGFWAGTSLIPGLSLAYPLLPGAISETMKFLTIALIIPPVEEYVFRFALLGALNSYFKKSKWIPIILSSAIFSIFHLTAYIKGWYDLPNIVSGFSAIGANLSVFITAFVFGLISSYFVMKKRIKNLAFSIVFHIGMNSLAYGLAVVTFV